MIHKSVIVRRPVAEAFRVFTEEIGNWWPLDRFSYGGDRRHLLILEGRPGGRFYERFRDGEEHEIGRVVAYEPPARVVFTWNEAGWEAPTEVEVRFTAEGDGTRVELLHRGWERIGADGTRIGHMFDRGWQEILALYAARAG